MSPNSCNIFYDNELLMLGDYPYGVSLHPGYTGNRSWSIWKL